MPIALRKFRHLSLPAKLAIVLGAQAYVFAVATGFCTAIAG